MSEIKGAVDRCTGLRKMESIQLKPLVDSFTKDDDDDVFDDDDDDDEDDDDVDDDDDDDIQQICFYIQIEK